MFSLVDAGQCLADYPAMSFIFVRSIVHEMQTS